MVNMGNKVNRIYGYPVGGNYGYSDGGASSGSTSMNIMDGFNQSTSIFGNSSNSSSGFGSNNSFNSGFNLNNSFNNNFNRGFSNGFNTNLSGGFTFSNFEGVNTSALNNGVSWNNMNNPALYNIPQINDNNASGFTMPSRSSISYIDETLKPLPDVKVSDDTDSSAYSMYGGNKSISYIDELIKPLPNLNLTESCDYDSYSMYGSGSSISYIDNLVKPINFNFNNGYANPYGGGYGQNNYSNNNSANKPTPYIPSNNGIYDQKAYQQYLDSVWGSNYASSIPSTQVNQPQVQGAKQNTQNGQNNTQKEADTKEAASEEAQNLKNGRPKSNDEKDLKAKVDKGEATEYEQELQEALTKRDNNIENNKELHKDVAKLFEALTLDQEDRAEKILNKYRDNGKLGELEEAFTIARGNDSHIQLREAIANSFTMKGLGWATKRYSPKVQKYLNMLDEDAAFSSPLNTALALRQTLTDGIFGFRVSQNRIRKLLNTLKEKDSTYINMVNDIYASQISGTDFYTDLYTKRFVPKELKNLASSVFDDTESSNSSSTDEN